MTPMIVGQLEAMQKLKLVRIENKHISLETTRANGECLQVNTCKLCTATLVHTCRLVIRRDASRSESKINVVSQQQTSAC